MSKSVIYSYTPQELQDLLDISTGYSNVLERMDLSPKGNNPKTLKKVIKEYNLDESQMNINRKKVYSSCGKNTSDKRTFKIEDILNGKYPNYQSSKLCKKLFKYNYKEKRCEECGIVDWNNKPITFHLHHKNGDHTDNRLDNLQILCPNCHSQTETYAGKNKI